MGIVFQYSIFHIDAVISRYQYQINKLIKCRNQIKIHLDYSTYNTMDFNTLGCYSHKCSKMNQM